MTGVERAFWRALAVFRIAALAYAAVLVLKAGGYAHPVTSWIVIGLMAVWTIAAIVLYSAPRRRNWPLLLTDVTVCTALLVCTRLAQSSAQIAAGTMPLTAIWVAGPVLAWGIQWGRRAGAASAIVLSLADFWVRGVRDLNATTPINGAVLLLLAGVVIGHVAGHARDAEARLERAVELEAAGRERERLARGIHDSVLQVLALVQKRGQEIGGDAAELGRLAGEQEAKLRELIRLAPAPVTLGRADLRESLRKYGSATATVSAPATPLLLTPHAAEEVTAAVGAALDNVRQHCGPDAPAWILVEEDDGTIIVTVRDDGPGIPESRLTQAEHDGRIGVAHSIRGRIAELGGTVTITSAVGRGTEVEIQVPAIDALEF